MKKLVTLTILILLTLTLFHTTTADTNEEPEVSALAKRELQKHFTILTNHEVQEAEKMSNGKKRLVAVNRESGEKTVVTAHEILVATGRSPNTDILHPESRGF